MAIRHAIQHVSTTCQTDASASLLKSKALTTSTQTEDFMFPMEEEEKRKLYELIGHKLAKHGDNYGKGSSFFTRARLILDDIDRYALDDSP